MSRKAYELQSNSYKDKPVIKSTYSYSMHEQILKICEHLDFNHPVFRRADRPVEARRRSAGTAQSFIVALALQDEKFIEKLKMFMWEGGRYYNFTAYSPDKIDIAKYMPKAIKKR